MNPTFVTVDEAIFDLKIETDAEDEDLENKINQAEAAIRGYVRRPLTLEAFQWILERPKEYGWKAIRMLTLPIYPLAEAGMSAGSYSADGDLEILDTNDDLVSTDDYRVERKTGLVYARGSYQFTGYPYVINAVAGLGGRPDYETYAVPLIRAGIFDMLRSLYLQRNPNAQTESTGGGISTTYFPDGVPKRIKEMLKPLRMERVV